MLKSSKLQELNNSALFFLQIFSPFVFPKYNHIHSSFGRQTETISSMIIYCWHNIGPHWTTLDHMCCVFYLAYRNIKKKMNDLTFESLGRKVATSLLNFPFPGLASLSRWSHCPQHFSSSSTRGTWPSSSTRRGGDTRRRRSSTPISSAGSWARQARRGQSTTDR